jgi:hypothetical protein
MLARQPSKYQPSAMREASFLFFRFRTVSLR